MKRPTTRLDTFECTVALPEWRLHLAAATRREDRELGNVMDTAMCGALAGLEREFPDLRLERSRTITLIRDRVRQMGIDPVATPPSSEVLIADFLKRRGLARGCLAWEFLALLTIRSRAPWSVLDRQAIEPPLVFRKGEPGEEVGISTGKISSEGLPVLADRAGVKASPWTPCHSGSTEDCAEPVFICYLPRDLFRSVQPKSHMGQVIWLTWAYRFLFQRSCTYGVE